MNLRLPSEHQRLFVLIGVGVIALAGLLLVTRVGGSGSGAKDAGEVMQKGFTSEPKSGVLSFKFTAGFQASNGQGQTDTVSVNGPATDGPTPEDPGESDLKHAKSSDGTRTEYRLISTGDAGYVGYQGRFYRMSDSQFKSVFADDSGEDESLVGALGFNPAGWMTDPTLAGTAELDGVTNDRVTSKVNVDAMLTDLDVIGPGAESSSASQELFANATKDGDATVLVGQSDGFLRKLDVTARASAQRQAAAVNVTMRLELALRDVNEPVNIKAPQDALPPSRIKEDIPRSVLTDEHADQLLGSPKKQGNGGDGSSGSTKSKSNQNYVNCVEQATDTAALEKCQALVP